MLNFNSIFNLEVFNSTFNFDMYQITKHFFCKHRPQYHLVKMAYVEEDGDWTHQKSAKPTPNI